MKVSVYLLKTFFHEHEVVQDTWQLFLLLGNQTQRCSFLMCCHTFLGILYYIEKCEWKTYKCQINIFYCLLNILLLIIRILWIIFSGRMVEVYVLLENDVHWYVWWYFAILVKLEISLHKSNYRNMYFNKSCVLLKFTSHATDTSEIRLIGCWTINNYWNFWSKVSTHHRLFNW